MYNRGPLFQLEDYFKEFNQRPQNVTYFCRLDSYDEEIRTFLIRYLGEIRKIGIYIKGKIPNPDERQLAFYQEIAGSDFQMDSAFIKNILQVWMPRLSPNQRNIIADLLKGILLELTSAGKNQNMIKNAYIKFMCWFYYKFERILSQLGKQYAPKILYEGTLSEYELKLMRILSGCGCDILILETAGDKQYLTLDPSSKYSQLILKASAKEFPKEFIISDLDRIVAPSPQTPPTTVLPSTPTNHSKSVFEIRTQGVMGTNIWISGDVLENILKPSKERGIDPAVYYNMFARIRGVEDIAEYYNQLFQWKLKIDTTHRKMVVVEKQIRMPDVTEVSKINRKNYDTKRQLLADMLPCINYPKSGILENLIKKAFVELIEECQEPIHIVANRAVCMICWLNRYIPELFNSWKLDEYPVFTFFGNCSSDNEALFLRLLSRIPVDVIIICPDLASECKVKDQRLFDKTYSLSLQQKNFPTSAEDLSFKTTAFNAEQDLNGILYQDTGMYRNRQFKQAIPVILQTTYEEIAILWDQESKYRSNFAVLDDRVMVPVIFSKVSGVKEETNAKYWDMVGKLVTEDTFVIKGVPFITDINPNPIKQHAVSFLKGGKLQLQKIRQHPSYPYGFIRVDMQDYMMDKLQKLLDSKLITGTSTNGVEFAIIAVALNLDKNILRLIQKYDFTREIPKLILINTTENLCSLEDSILIAYLSMLGFDVLIFVPTGYQSVERFYDKPIMTEHQVGKYVYDMRVPDFKRISVASYTDGLIGKIFKKGR